jgi:predicted acetyltransferase
MVWDGIPIAEPAAQCEHDPMTIAVRVVPATIDDKPTVLELLQLYMYDFSEFQGWDLADRGRYEHRSFDNWWTDADRHPFLIRADGRLAGMAMVQAGAPHDMAEFFVLRKYRRDGVGSRAARTVFAMFPGEWQVRQIAANTGATAFWRRIIPVPFVDDANEHGPVQRFRIEGDAAR